MNLEKEGAKAYKYCMKRILVIDESSLFRDYLKHKIESFGIETVLAANGLEGSLKLRGVLPDLIIMDSQLTRKTSLELLKEKNDNPNTARVPVIMTSSNFDREKVVEMAKWGVRKIFTKPVKMDALLKTTGEILGLSIDLDSTPCIVSAHFNDEIIIVEVAMGLNVEKIELLKFKLIELRDLYQVRNPNVLLIMSNIEIRPDDSLKLSALLSVVSEYSGIRTRMIKILTNSAYVRTFIDSRKDFSEIEVTNNLEKAMDGLLGRKTGSYIDGDRKVVHQEFLSAATPKKPQDEKIQFRFEGERVQDISFIKEKLRFAVVDDDPVIQEFVKAAFSDTPFEISVYDNGKLFLDVYREDAFDMIFLDLMMPVMDGFETLKNLVELKNKIPVIVLSALSRKETVIKALTFGVRSYLIKPLKPEWIRKKATEILQMNF